MTDLSQDTAAEMPFEQQVNNFCVSRTYEGDCKLLRDVFKQHEFDGNNYFDWDASAINDYFVTSRALYSTNDNHHLVYSMTLNQTIRNEPSQYVGESIAIEFGYLPNIKALAINHKVSPLPFIKENLISKTVRNLWLTSNVEVDIPTIAKLCPNLETFVDMRCGVSYTKDDINAIASLKELKVLVLSLDNGLVGNDLMPFEQLVNLVYLDISGKYEGEQPFSYYSNRTLNIQFVGKMSNLKYLAIQARGVSNFKALAHTNIRVLLAGAVKAENEHIETLLKMSELHFVAIGELKSFVENGYFERLGNHFFNQGKKWSLYLHEVTEENRLLSTKELNNLHLLIGNNASCDEDNRFFVLHDPYSFAWVGSTFAGKLLSGY